jgi:hypothetical protein
LQQGRLEYEPGKKGGRLMKNLGKLALIASCVLALSSATLAESAVDAYKALGIEAGSVMNGTTFNVQVIPGDERQLVCMTTYLTGKKEESIALEVRLDVLMPRGGELVSLYSRRFGEENGGYVADGNLQVLDLDRDGVSEIIVTYGSFTNPLIDLVLGEVIFYGKDNFETVWKGPMEYDATRAARDIPAERRDRYLRQLDPIATMRSGGATLFFNKSMITVAGQRLPTPKTVKETFPIRIQER